VGSLADQARGWRAGHGIIRIRIHPPLIHDFVRALEKLMKKFDLDAIGGSLIVLERGGL